MNSGNHWYWIGILTISISICSTTSSNAQLDISWYTMDSGGGNSVGGMFELDGTIGQIDAGTLTGGTFKLTGGFWAVAQPATLLGDVNLDGTVNLLDVDPFVDRISSGTYQAEADCNQDGTINLLDIDPFIAILGGG